MKKHNFGKALAAILAAALFTGALSACGKEDLPKESPGAPANDSPADGDKGRYVEQEEPLPEELADWSLLQIFTSGGRIHFLAARQQEGKTILGEWALEENGFAEVTPGWLSSLEIAGGDWVDAKLVVGSEGSEYLCAGYVAEGEENFLTHLWKGEGDTAREITPDKWKIPNEDWGSYEMIQGMALLDNGSLAALSYSSLDILSGDDGSVLETTPLSVFYEGGLLTDGKNLYLRSSGESGMQIEKWTEGKSSNAEIIPFTGGTSTGGNVISIGGTGSLALDVLPDGTLIAADENGIFRLSSGSGEQQWEMLAEGMETDFSLAENTCLGLCALEDGSIYALFQSEDRQKLNRYVYDPDAVSEVKEVLRLYTIYENSLLKQAATMYHKLHPEVMISIEYEYPLYYYGETDYDSIYKKLNTMLLGDNAPDLLVLDHLNVDSYVSKGLLENLEDIVRPLEDSSALLSNITGAFAADDQKQYAVPLQFSFFMALGRDIAPEDMGSLEKLAEFLSHTDYSYLGTQTVTELVDKFYPYFCDDIVAGKQLDKEAMGKYLDYLKAIGDNCGIIDSRPENELSYGMWELASQAKLALQETDGFTDCMFPMSVVDYIKGNYTSFENSFRPSLLTGICTKSQYTETAKDFLRFALSEQIQDNDYYNGFPVNKASLLKQAEKDRSQYTAATMIASDDGGYIEFESKAYSAETARQLCDICENVTKPVKEDAKIREVLIECLGGYLDGSLTRDETVQKIEDGLKMYLAE